MDERTPRIDFVLLADRAEVLNGKLYAMGGGWEVLNLRQLGEMGQFSIAIAVIVPWNATNADHAVTLRVEDADGRDLMQVQAGFRTGRPPHIDQGAEQRLMFIVPVALPFASTGSYVVVATLGAEERRAPFRVHIGIGLSNNA